jgi:hypothetical protein
MRVLATISDENFSELRARWRRFEREGDRIRATGTSEADDLDAGGRLLEIDWDRGELLQSVELSMPTGVAPRPGGFAVCAHNRFYLLDEKLRIEEEWSHGWFNNLHALCQTATGWAVAASGLDAVLWLNSDFEMQGYWSAIESGYSHDPYGRTRSVDMNASHDQVSYPTLMHTTHLNGVAWLEEESSLYITLFHQGELVKLDGRGCLRLLMRGLSTPHGIQRIGGDEMALVQSKRNRMSLWRRGDVRSARAIDLPTDWAQDVRPLPVREGSGRAWLVADSGNNRILEVDEKGAVQRQFAFDHEWRIHQLLVCP